MKYIQIIILLCISIQSASKEFTCSDYDGEQRFTVDSLTGVIKAQSPKNILENSKAEKVKVITTNDAFSVTSNFNGQIHRLNVHSDIEGDAYLFNYNGSKFDNLNLYGICN